MIEIGKVKEMPRDPITENKLQRGKDKLPKEISQTNMNQRKNNSGKFLKKKRDLKMANLHIN
jgi:hypothetical protein